MPYRIVSPAELIQDGSGRPRRLQCRSRKASEHAARLSLGFEGPDLAIDAFLPLSALARRGNSRPMTYLSASFFAPDLAGHRELVVVTKPDLRRFAPAGSALLLTDGNPRDTFYSLLAGALEREEFEVLESHISDSATIAPSAVISPHVYVSEGANIGPGAVLLPNTYVGPDVIVKPNAVIGGNGFEAACVNGARQIVPHAGGVWLDRGVQIGACSCVDKGLIGDFTTIGCHTLIDNLVHFGHCASAGQNCSITAGAEISGSAVLDDGVWIGPNSTIQQMVHIGAHCFIGRGSVVVRNLAPYTLAYGSPAKAAARVCECRRKLHFVEGHATCEACQRAYALLGDKVVRR